MTIRDITDNILHFAEQEGHDDESIALLADLSIGTVINLRNHKTNSMCRTTLHKLVKLREFLLVEKYPRWRSNGITRHSL